MMELNRHTLYFFNRAENQSPETHDFINRLTASNWML